MLVRLNWHGEYRDDAWARNNRHLSHHRPLLRLRRDHHSCDLDFVRRTAPRDDGVLRHFDVDAPHGAGLLLADDGLLLRAAVVPAVPDHIDGPFRDVSPAAAGSGHLCDGDGGPHPRGRP